MRSGLAAFILLIIAVPAIAQEPIDLPQAINSALEQNRELVRSALSVDSGNLGIDGADAEFRLSVRPDGSAEYSTDDSSVGYGLAASKKLVWGSVVSARSGVSRFAEEDADDLHRGSITLEVRQPLFRNFGPLIHGEGRIQADRRLRSARRRLELQKADLVVQVVETYETILRLKRQIRSDQASFNRMDALYRVTKAKEPLGRATRVDSLRVELLRGEALARLETSREGLASARQDFAELLGFPPETVYELTPSPVLEISLPEAGEAVRIALENRLDYAEALQNSEDADRGVRIARRKLLPDLNLTIGHERFGEGPNSSDAARLNDSIWFISLSADTDLNLARERIALGQSRVNQVSAKQQIEILELTIARQVQQQLLSYRRVQGELKIAERNLQLAEGRAKLARRLFELGRGENFSVTDAEEALLRTENRLFSTQAAVSGSGYRLFRVLGTLIEFPGDLKPRALFTKR